MAIPTSESNVNLTGAVEALAAAIQSVPCWRAWHDAQEAVEQDPEMGAVLARYRELAQRRRQASAQGNRQPYKELLELGELERKITECELFRQRDAAMADLYEFLVTVNGMLSERIEIDFAAIAAPRRSCCG